MAAEQREKYVTPIEIVQNLELLDFGDAAATLERRKGPQWR